MFSSKSNMLLLMLLLFSIALAACSGTNTTNNNAGSKEQPSETAPANKMITVSWPRDVGPMNPHVYNPSQLIAQSMIYEPLVNYTEGGEVVPFLAESWTISEDGKTYSFKIRQNVTFSDGTLFNAKVAKKNFDAVMKHVENHSWLGFIGLLDKTEAVDEYTFNIVLKQAYFPTLQELSVVRPVRFLGEAGFPDDGDTSKGVKEPIGTGPWMLTDYKTDEYAEFTRNPNYWGEQPIADKLVFRIIPDGDTRVLAFEKGELDLIYGEGAISMDAFLQLQDNDDYETQISSPVATRQLVMNTTNAALSDKNVRLALQHGFNKEAMVQGITSGLEDLADSLLSSNFPYAQTNPAPLGYDVEKAKAYLDEAGWLLPEGKSVREKNGKPLEVELIYEKTDQIIKPMAETLQAEWAGIGVKLNLSGLELTEQIKRFRAGQFDLYFFSNYGAPYDPSSFFHIVAEKSFGIAEALANLPMKDELDRQVQEALATTDENKRKELFDAIQTTLHEEGALVPISYIKKTVVYNKKISSFAFPGNRDDNPFSSIELNR
ncbi:nickel ABC transporter substrate-binding protein [Paenibacillus arenilitoris]|uniref:Nickel ABC transporter, nickel/metallophore periplasmic binding protein n=1 Tax=Paenibacillus arenilitoris TaxID=2772299 RepID=A0A927CPP6_9BACL|nr:nickel ABC transporter substrate-binding protein [Paenibacillus arenilitoris]MBD2871889.1 nickel ABC transporter, nickel/metallophore periplasmic binding protein [Paenibacillus arenilitoris]